MKFSAIGNGSVDRTPCAQEKDDLNRGDHAHTNKYEVSLNSTTSSSLDGETIRKQGLFGYAVHSQELVGVSYMIHRSMCNGFVMHESKQVLVRKVRTSRRRMTHYLDVLFTLFLQCWPYP